MRKIFLLMTLIFTLMTATAFAAENETQPNHPPKINPPKANSTNIQAKFTALKLFAP